MHNDIHKGNWKVRKLKEDRYAIVVYDFGFCGKGNLKNRPIIEKMTTMFECSDENTDNTENYVSMTQFFVMIIVMNLNRLFINIYQMI